MKYHSLICTGPEVLAIRDGRKTQFRRLVRLRKSDSALPYLGGIRCMNIDAGWIEFNYQNPTSHKHARSYGYNCPFGQPGDRIWCIQIRPISFGDGKYGVGDDGNLYDISGGHPIRRKTRLSHNGYEEISLRFKGATRAARINRLVCEAFYGPPPQALTDTGEVIEVRHIDGKKRNNLPENLDWGTRQQNASDASAAGAWSGEKNSGSRLSKDDIASIRAANEPQSVLANRYGVTQPTISKIIGGKRWKSPQDAPPRNTVAWSSRITLEVTGVKVERLQDITEADANAEGFPSHLSVQTLDPARADFAAFWDSLNAKRGHPWSANPYVWAVEFKMI